MLSNESGHYAIEQPTSSSHEQETRSVSIVAYRERDSTDPMTGEEGILRDEWRVRGVSEFKDRVLAEAWGTKWRRWHPFASHVLEHRYIRRGLEEPWTPFEPANSFEQALACIGEATPCCEALRALQELRKEEEDKRLAEAERIRKLALEEEDRAYHKRRAQAAFERLSESRDAIWAERWHAFIARHAGDEEFKAKAERDPKFMALYQAAMEAETVPSKRKAIRLLLEYVEKQNFSKQQ